MAQLCNVLRAYVHEGMPLVEAIAKTNEFALRLLPGAFATVAAVAVDLNTGEAEAVCAGHPLPFLLRAGAYPEPPPVRISPPLGVQGVRYTTTPFRVEPDDVLVMFSDGLIERRGEGIDVGRRRLADTLVSLSLPDATTVRTAVTRDSSIDDATIVALHRPRS